MTNHGKLKGLRDGYLNKKSMETWLGNEGIDKSWQKDFNETEKCPKCGGTARIMFVASEGLRGDKPKKWVTDLHENDGEGGFWPHDAIATAVYLCKECFNPVTKLNQA